MYMQAKVLSFHNVFLRNGLRKGALKMGGVINSGDIIVCLIYVLLFYVLLRLHQYILAVYAIDYNIQMYIVADMLLNDCIEYMMCSVI